LSTFFFTTDTRISSSHALFAYLLCEVRICTQRDGAEGDVQPEAAEQVCQVYCPDACGGTERPQGRQVTLLGTQRPENHKHAGQAAVPVHSKSSVAGQASEVPRVSPFSAAVVPIKCLSYVRHLHATLWRLEGRFTRGVDCSLSHPGPRRCAPCQHESTQSPTQRLYVDDIASYGRLESIPQVSLAITCHLAIGLPHGPSRGAFHCSAAWRVIVCSCCSGAQQIIGCANV
jgi:hypothetical protein